MCHVSTQKKSAPAAGFLSSAGLFLSDADRFDSDILALVQLAVVASLRFKIGMSTYLASAHVRRQFLEKVASMLRGWAHALWDPGFVSTGEATLDARGVNE